jgi:hypothetical protein
LEALRAHQDFKALLTEVLNKNLNKAEPVVQEGTKP